jgi:hypothetical protein
MLMTDGQVVVNKAGLTFALVLTHSPPFLYAHHDKCFSFLFNNTGGDTIY